MRDLGELEAVVMDLIWRRAEPATVRDLHQQLTAIRPLAYTTVLTVMDNLHGKGFLQREMTGRAWLYRPVVSREQHAAALMRAALTAATDQTAALALFIDQMSASESQALRDLLRHGRTGQR